MKLRESVSITRGRAEVKIHDIRVGDFIKAVYRRSGGQNLTSRAKIINNENITRRWFLKTLGALGLSLLFPRITAATSYQKPLLKNMNALVEAIMPGAKDLGIHKKLRGLAFKRPDTAKTFTLGLKAMNKYSMNKYGKSFYSLDENEKDSVLKWMDGLPRARQERFFFIVFRQAVLEYYYTSPYTWKTLKYNGPPQPNGFMDYHLSPEGNRG